LTKAQLGQGSGCGRIPVRGILPAEIELLDGNVAMKQRRVNVHGGVQVQVHVEVNVKGS